MCKPEHRVAADRRGFRYPSDLSDAEWTPIMPLIPPAKRGGRKRTVEVPEILNAIFYVLATGCHWSRAVSPRGLCQRSLGQAATQSEPALPPALNVRAGLDRRPKKRAGEASVRSPPARSAIYGFFDSVLRISPSTMNSPKPR